jgi:outer membrane murein-binding lipoprotein Lpp
VWYAVAILAVIVVVGFAGAGYELNHLRTEVNTLNAQVNNLNQELAAFYSALMKLAARLK